MVFLYDAYGSVIGMQYRNSTYDSGEWDTYYYEKNLQGDVIAVYSSSGTKVISYRYNAWGLCSYTSTTSTARYNPFRYRSYYYDTDLQMYYLATRYYEPNTCRFITMDDPYYLGANGDLVSYNLFAYCSNNPVMYVDPTGHSALLMGLLIFTGAMTLGSAIYGGVSAGMAGGDAGDVFTGIGKGALNGLIFGGGISLAIGGFAIGGATTVGSIMVTYGLSISANMLEVAITQGKKSYYDGDSFWAGASDINNAMFANSGNILIGNPTLMSIPFYGTRITTKIPTVFNVLVTYDVDRLFGPTTFLASAKTTLLGKANPLILSAGYLLTAGQYYSLIRSIVTTPDFETSKWILY